MSQTCKSQDLGPQGPGSLVPGSQVLILAYPSLAGPDFRLFLLLIKLKIFKRDFSTGVSCEYCKSFTNSFFYRTHPMASVDLLFLIKINVKWFLPKKFVDLVRVHYLQIISRNHSSTLLLINLRKTNTSPKQSATAKAICSDFRVLTV